MTSSVPSFMLADLSAEDLSREMVRLAQASAPEWKAVQDGDPGKAIIDAVAWMGHTVLYRVNLLTRRQRLEFLRLLGLRLAEAQPARGVVALAHARPVGAAPRFVTEATRLSGPVPFETRTPLTVQPFEGRVFYKRRIASAERDALRDVLDDLAELYDIDVADPYATTPLFADGRAIPAGVDPMAESVDAAVWVALFALDDTPAAREAALAAFDDQPALLNIGVVPRLSEPDGAPEVSPLDHYEWALTSSLPAGALTRDSYLALRVEDDRTAQLTREGTLRLALPVRANVALPDDDVDAGVGERPPRLDDPRLSARLVAWVRLASKDPSPSLPLSWLGINAAMVDAHETERQVQVGVASGRPAQTVQLPARNVDAATFAFSVQEEGKGFVAWRLVDDLATASRTDRAAVLNAADGTLTLGDGLNGILPAPGARVRVDHMRSGGGAAGNVPAGTLASVEAPGLTAAQPAPLSGGRRGETLEEGERRVKAFLQHRDRCVTAADYRSISATLDVARVEVLPRLRPYQMNADSPGVVSVLALPFKAAVEAPNPRPDRRLVERVRAHIEPRRPLGTEVFVVAADYVPLAVAIGLDVREGFAEELVSRAVRDAITGFLWPLAGGGREGAGWPMGAAVLDLEVELIAARVPGVLTTSGVNLFAANAASATGFTLVPREASTGRQTLTLSRWQLPECLEVAVAVGATAPPDTVVGLFGSGGAGAGTAIPVVPEVC
ncbi:MAG: putative baseplate assembly protein [Pseudomonadota bacterium]